VAVVAVAAMAISAKAKVGRVTVVPVTGVVQVVMPTFSHQNLHASNAAPQSQVTWVVEVAVAMEETVVARVVATLTLVRVAATLTLVRVVARATARATHVLVTGHALAVGQMSSPHVTPVSSVGLLRAAVDTVATCLLEEVATAVEVADMAVVVADMAVVAATADMAEVAVDSQETVVVTEDGTKPFCPRVCRHHYLVL